MNRIPMALLAVCCSAALVSIAHAQSTDPSGAGGGRCTLAGSDTGGPAQSWSPWRSSFLTLPSRLWSFTPLVSFRIPWTARPGVTTAMRSVVRR